MKVLSCFDGMSCGQIAFERAGIPIEKYYASEIDKYAIQVTQANYPDTIQLGSITEWQSWNIEQPDIIIGGSPCQGFSFAGKQLNFEDERSKLFFTFVDILKHYRPKYFLLENVKMKQEFQDIISEQLGVKPILINSSLVSAQNRERLYWTNIPVIGQPIDKGILLKDIIEDGQVLKDKSQTILAILYKENAKSMIKRNKQGLLILKNIYPKKGQNGNVYSIFGKCKTLSAGVGIKGNGIGSSNAPKIESINADGWRKLSPLECERLQTIPDNYTAKGLDIYYYNIIQFIKIVINGDCECKNVKLKDAVIKYRTSLQDCAINIIYDLSDTEQQNLPEIKLINQKNVKLKDAEEIEKQMRDFVCSIIKDSTELAKLNLTKNKNKNANIVIETQLQKDCVINTIRIIEGTETQNIQIKKEKNLINTDIKNLMENMLLSIEKSMKMNTISNYQKMILSIILTLISKIMTLKIFTNVVYPNTQLFISSSIKLQGNLLEVDVSNLKMENISSVSNSQRYKMLGNGWTVDVIAHIFSFLKEQTI